MTTQPPHSVTDAEVDAAINAWYDNISPGRSDRKSMRRALEQFAQSREYGRACIAASQAGRAEAGMSTLTEVEAYKIFLFASLKKDCERPNGITAGKKIKYSVADNLLLLSVRYPSLAEAMK